jgi:sec-independent protein translocase protein TatC
VTAAPARRQPSTPDELASMPLMDHIRELRTRILVSAAAVAVGMAASLFVTRPVINGLEHMCTVCDFIFIRPTEAFAAYFRTALLLGLILALPVILYQAVAFIVPGLHRHERRVLYLMLPGAGVLFALGLAFGYFLVVPRSINFLATFLGQSAAPAWSLGLYISFVTNLLFVIGITFQTPLVVFVLARLGLATPSRLAHYRRHAIVAIAIAAAVLTPTPDPFTMFLVMVPMVVLYELGILLARLA